jgi:hypothetical protein
MNRQVIPKAIRTLAVFVSIYGVAAIAAGITRFRTVGELMGEIELEKDRTIILLLINGVAGLLVAGLLWALDLYLGRPKS